MAKVKMKVKRIEKLIDLLENFKEQRPKGKVDMQEFGLHIGEHAPEEKNWCGTTACALGWATTIPELKRAGLIGTWRCMRLSTGENYGTLEISFRDKRTSTTFSDPIQAGARLFGISTEVAAHLFGGDTTTRALVVKRMKKLIEIGVEAYEKKYHLNDQLTYDNDGWWA